MHDESMAHVWKHLNHIYDGGTLTCCCFVYHHHLRHHWRWSPFFAFYAFTAAITTKSSSGIYTKKNPRSHTLNRPLRSMRTHIPWTILFFVRSANLFFFLCLYLLFSVRLFVNASKKKNIVETHGLLDCLRRFYL